MAVMGKVITSYLTSDRLLNQFMRPFSHLSNDKVNSAYFIGSGEDLVRV